MADGLGLREIAAHIGTILLQRVGSLILQISTVVLLAHLLGPQGFGQYAVAILLPGVLAVVLNPGLRAASVYALGRGASVRVIVRWNLRLGGPIVACGLALSVIILAGASDRLFPGVPSQLLWIGSCGFPTYWFYNSMTGVLQGKQDFRRYNLAMLMNPAATLVAVVLLVWAAGLGASGAVAAWVSGQTCGLLSTAWFVRRHYAAESGDPTPDSHERPDLIYGLKTHLAHILAFVNYRIDIFLVNFFLGPAGAGIYAAAVRVAEQLWLISGATAVVLFPRLAGLHLAEETRRQVTPLIARWVTLVVLGMALVLAFTMDWLVPLVFGPEYGDTAAVLLWLLPGSVVYGSVMVLSPDLSARGRPDPNAWAAGVSLAFNVVGNLLLIPHYGVIGAAAATTLAYVAAGLLTTLFYTRLSHNRLWDLIRMGRTDWDMIKMATATVRAKKS
jgi:O-antigen/teichoic acid export membrane protein